MSTEHPDSAPRPPRDFQQPRPTPGRAWPLRASFWLLSGIAAFFLVTEHRAHLVAGLSWLPILLLLACPLIHVFGHRGHGEHGASRPHSHGGDLP